MTFARIIMVLLAASAASAAAFAPTAPLSAPARLVQSEQAVARAWSIIRRAPRAMTARRRTPGGVNGMAMAWNSNSYLIAPSIVNADLVSCGPTPHRLLRQMPA